jgi:hypothetical protein
MLIKSCSRQCILKLKEYSDKKHTIPPRRTRTHLTSVDIEALSDNDNPLNNPTFITPLVSSNRKNLTNQLTDTSTEIIEDRSFLGRFLNCKPCRQVTENQRHRLVC